MGVILNQPTYPVLDRVPGFWRTVGFMNMRDWGFIAGVTALHLPVGYVIGTRTKLPIHHMYMTAGVGLLGSFMYAYQSSAGRLMGFFPNDREVEATLGKKQSWRDA